jgi:anaerobic selenocysteine-containing dehydrogenase
MPILKTFCSICNPHSHCGINAHVEKGELVSVEGMPEHPANQGTLCSKGAASVQYVYARNRVKYPMVQRGSRGSNDWERITWDEALSIAASRLGGVRKQHGPESVVFFAGYPKWYRPFLQRLAISFGSPNFCTESSTCNSSPTVAGNITYGHFGRPDLPRTRCLLVWSANPYHTNSTQVRHLLDLKEKGVKFISVDPRVSSFAEKSDLHLQLRPGTDGALALAMIKVLIEENLYDRSFVEQWTVGFDELWRYVNQLSLDWAESVTKVPKAKIVEAARLYGTTKPASLMTSASATTHHINGFQNHRAILLLPGLTGNFDIPGGNWVETSTYTHVFSGAPTREREIRLADRIKNLPPRIGEDRFQVWSRHYDADAPEAQSMMIPFQIQSGKPYPLKAFVGFGANYRMWPGSEFLKESLLKLDFLMNTEIFFTDTCQFMDLVLPAATTFERSELKHYNSKYLMLTSPVIQPVGESRSDLDIIFGLASHLGMGDLFWNGNLESAIDDLMGPSGYTAKELRQYPAGTPVKNPLEAGYRKYEREGFHTPSGKMEIASSILKDAGFDAIPVFRAPQYDALAQDASYPLMLNTGSRLPMFVHSAMHNVPWCQQLRKHPTADLNPSDAAGRGIRQNDWVWIQTDRGKIHVKANLTETVLPGVVHMFHGIAEADVNSMIAPDYLDPISGFPGFKSVRCQVLRDG